MTEQGDGFYQSINKISLQNREDFRQQPVNEGGFAQIIQTVDKSLAEQTRIEQSDSQSFDDFIAQYFSVND